MLDRRRGMPPLPRDRVTGTPLTRVQLLRSWLLRGATRFWLLVAVALAAMLVVAVVPIEAPWSVRLLVVGATTATASFVAAARRSNPVWLKAWRLFAVWAWCITAGGLMQLLGMDRQDPLVLGVNAGGTLPALVGLGLVLRLLYEQERLFPAFLDGWLFVGSIPALAVGLFLVPPIPWDALTEPGYALAAATVALDLVLLALLGGVAISVRGANRIRAGWTALGIALLGLSHTLLLRDVLGAASSPTAVDVAQALAFALLAVIPWIGSNRLAKDERRDQSVSGVTYPYVVAFLALASVATWLLVDEAVDFGLLMLGLSLVVALVLRQALTVQDNVRLLRELAAREDHFKSLVIGSSDVIVVVDEESLVAYVSPAVERQFGYRVADLLGVELLSIVHPDDRTSFKATLARVLNGRGLPARVAARVADAGGAWRNTESTLSSRDRDVVINLRDVSDRVALGAQMERLAFHDPLTGLTNRARFMTSVESAVATQAGKAGYVGVLFLDLDGFKSVNDTAGHEAGDSVLIESARRLAASIGPHDIASRWGGDEFAVLVARRESTQEIQKVATEVVAAMGVPHRVGAREYYAGTSIGVAWTDEVVDASALVRNADLAMYRAKQAGKGRVESFRPQMLEQAVERAETESRIVRALEDRSLALSYQPVIQLRGRRLVAVEALLRWTDSAGRPGQPADLISFAEKSGQIEALGTWAIGQALADSASWRSEGARLDVAVNLSARQIAAPGIVPTVERLLKQANVLPSELTLEITETLLVEDKPEVTDRLRELRRLGVRLVLDDFGTGYSSLAYLNRLPVDGLKLDKAFVTGLGYDLGADALVRSVVRLGRELGLLVTAEGVETLQQADRLERLGCPRAQGFLFSAALSPAEVVQLIKVRPSERWKYVSDGETVQLQA